MVMQICSSAKVILCESLVLRSLLPLTSFTSVVMLCTGWNERKIWARTSGIEGKICVTFFLNRKLLSVPEI